MTKRALLVGTSGSPYLFFLRLLTENEHSGFTSRRCAEFEGVRYFTADVYPSSGDDDVYVLDATGNTLKNHGLNVYHDDDLSKPEIPQQMKGMGTQSDVAIAASKR